MIEFKTDKKELHVMKAALEMFAGHCTQAGSDENRRRIARIWNRINKHLGLR